MVLAGSASTKPEGKQSSNASHQVIEDTETDPENELTLDTNSSISSSLNSSTSSIFSTPIVVNSNAGPTASQQTAAQSDLNENRVPFRTNLTPKQQYEIIHSEYLRQYESMGISIHDNSWYSAYVQQLALYKYM